MLGEGPEPVAEFGRVPRVEVDFVRPAVQGELDGLIRWPASQVIFQLQLDSVHYFPPHGGLRLILVNLVIAVLLQDWTLSLSGPDL